MTKLCVALLAVLSIRAFGGKLVDFVWEQAVSTGGSSATMPEVGGVKFDHTFYGSVENIGALCGSGQMWHCPPKESWADENTKPPPGAQGVMVSLGGSGGHGWGKLDGLALGEKLVRLGYIGVDLDWETEQTRTNGDHILAEMKKMRQQYKDLEIIVTIMGAYPKRDHFVEWEYVAKLHTNDILDYVGLMMYGIAMTGPKPEDFNHKNDPAFIAETLDYAAQLGIPMNKIFLALTTNGCDDEYVQIFADKIQQRGLAGSAWWQGDGLPERSWLETLGGHFDDAGPTRPPTPAPPPTPAQPLSPTTAPSTPPPSDCPYKFNVVDGGKWYERWSIDPRPYGAWPADGPITSKQSGHTETWRHDLADKGLKCWYLEPGMEISTDPFEITVAGYVCTVESPLSYKTSDATNYTKPKVQLALAPNGVFVPKFQYGWAVPSFVGTAAGMALIVVSRVVAGRRVRQPHLLG